MDRTWIGAVAALAVCAFVRTTAVAGLTSGSLVQGVRSRGLGTAATCSQSGWNLTTSGHFRVLARTTVTSTGLTVVHGNLGVSPGAGVTGFGPGKVIGATESNTTAAASAQASRLTACTDGAARTNCATNVAGNLGGTTRRPGLYVSSSSLASSSGDLTLSANGHPNAGFIFQMETTRTTAAGPQEILTGGANATHIYWIVGSSATLGGSSVVSGSILAYASIIHDTSVPLHRRALAMNRAVSLDVKQARK